MTAHPTSLTAQQPSTTPRRKAPKAREWRHGRPAPALRDPVGGHVPGLDGLRGAAVLAVVAYHVWPHVVPAGFLGVSLFFTLSGFLITRLVLAEHERTGTVDLRAFWRRRMRRLLPASLATLLVVGAGWGVAGWLTGRIRGDIIASLLYVANWRFLASGTEYGVDTDATPVLHFWSLAIEEQFYVVFPLVAWLAFRSRRRPAAALGALAGGLLAASVALTVAQAGEQQTVYLSSATRAAEVLIGVLLGVGFASPGVRRALGRASALGAVAASALVVLAVATDFYTSAWSRGGLIGVGLLSALAILGSCRPGPLAAVLSIRPLTHLGRISYGVYLFHWPLLVMARQLGWHSAATAAVTILGSLALAQISLVLLETPIRRSRWRLGHPGVLALSASMLVLVVAVWGSSRATVVELDFAALREEAARDRAAVTVPSTPPTDAPGSDPGSSAPPTTTPPGPLPVAMFGDSTGLVLGLALRDADPRIEVRGIEADLGCPISRGGELKGTYETDEGAPGGVARCDWTESWPTLIREGGATTAIVYGGFWDTLPRRLPERWSGWRNIEDPVVAAYVLEEVLAATDAVHAAGARTVVWGTLAPNTKVNSEQNIRRVAIYNDLLADAAAQRPDVIRIVDLAGWFAEQPGSPRPDGVHVSDEAAPVLVRTWLADQLLTASGR